MICASEHLPHGVELLLGDQHKLAIQALGNQLQGIQPRVSSGFQTLVLLAGHTHTQHHVALLKAQLQAPFFNLLQ